MPHRLENGLSRRNFLKLSATTAAGLPLLPYINRGQIGVSEPMKRIFGRTGFEVTTLGLGGQAAIQWTPADVDPVSIILKAFDLGVNYFDTSNLYGPSQRNFGNAFRSLHLAPGLPGYDESRRRSIFLTSKTGLRYAKGASDRRDLFSWTNGSRESGAVGDLKRTLSQVFGDGEGAYPDGAYLDMILMHNVTTQGDVEAVYEGYSDPDPQAERIGAFAALIDYRDGTNLTGLNPLHEKLVRHIGFSGHHSPPVMMDMIQRDERDALDGMLVAINANDRHNFSMQHNVIPVAAAKGMGIIAMKVFADGAMYSKEATWSNTPDHVVRTVGASELPSRPLVEYALSTPGIHTAIIGIGQIDETPARCQLAQNLSAAQIEPGGLSETDRLAVEEIARRAKEGRTNYFQIAAEPLGAPREASAELKTRDGSKVVSLSWQTAYAAGAAIRAYEIRRDGEKIGETVHRPQVTREPFTFTDEKPGMDRTTRTYQIITVDAQGNRAATGDLIVATGS